MTFTRPGISGQVVHVEVVYALPDRQELIELEVADSACVADVIREAAIEERFPGNDLSVCEVGIWGRLVTRDTPVCNGDRVEIYRPLVMDAREARRMRAKGSD